MQTFSSRPFYRTQLFFFTVLIVVLGAALAAAGVLLALPRDLGDGYGAVLSTVKLLEKALLGKAVAIYAAMAVLIAATVVLLHLFYSHRIAGPAYRLAREAASIGQGKLKGEIRFRRKDSLTDMADSLNQAAERYRDRVTEARDALSIIEAKTESIAHLIQRGEGAPAVEQALRDVTSRLQKIESVIAEVRT